MTILSLLVIPFFALHITQVIACEQNIEEHCIQVSVHNKKGVAVSDIVVYLKPLSGQILPPSSEIVTISQKDKAFSPYITVSQANNKVNFVNQDDITHHIYSAGGEDNFSFVIQAGTEHMSASFDNETEVAMGCNIHDWMSGSLLVVETPYFGKTDNNGNVGFKVDILGRYRVVVWHPQLSTANHRLSQDHDIATNSTFNFVLPKNLESIPTQSSNDDFDFVSDY